MTAQVLSESAMQESRLLKVLADVTDPEIPVLSILEMGILRNVSTEDGVVYVTLTPTYSGCPALDQITQDVENALNQAGFPNHVVKITLSPAWTTDWMTDEAKEKLRKYGVAPPCHTKDLNQRTGEHRLKFSPRCPQCGSLNTVQQSEFGSTACKALWKCNSCLEPFDYFKPI